jgi:hypothetical protein
MKPQGLTCSQKPAKSRSCTFRNMLVTLLWWGTVTLTEYEMTNNLGSETLNETITNEA